MKTDTYTKTVLTIIAFSLTIIAFNQIGFFTKANATSSVISSKPYGLVPLNADGSINVNVKSSETLYVNVVDADLYSLKYAGPLKVQIER